MPPVRPPVTVGHNIPTMFDSGPGSHHDVAGTSTSLPSAHTKPVGPCAPPFPQLKHPTHGVWTCDYRGHHGTTAVHDTSWLPRGPFGNMAHQLLKAPLQHNVVDEDSWDSPRSSLVSLARSHVSVTLPRLWSGAQWTVTAQETRDHV